MSTFVAAPQLIQPSVAIETGLVFLSALQLEVKKKLFKIFMGVPSSVCMHQCVRVCVRAHIQLQFIHSFHFEVRKKMKAALVVPA